MLKRWNNEEVKIAIGLLENGYSYDEIAKELNRSGKAIRLKLLKNGYKITDYNKKEYNEKINCLNCDKEFIASKKEERKFCGHSCSATFTNKIRKRKDNVKLKNCLNCDKLIEGRNKRYNKYCDSKCQWVYQWKEKKKEIEKGEVKTNTTLRRYVIERDGCKCIECKGVEWNGKVIPLVLDHINGDPYNNLPINLRMLCPNCDAQTDTYKGKNIGNGRHERMKRYNEGKSY